MLADYHDTHTHTHGNPQCIDRSRRRPLDGALVALLSFSLAHSFSPLSLSHPLSLSLDLSRSYLFYSRALTRLCLCEKQRKLTRIRGLYDKASEVGKVARKQDSAASARGAEGGLFCGGWCKKEIECLPLSLSIYLSLVLV
jgi:hypothetical protein